MSASLDQACTPGAFSLSVPGTEVVFLEATWTTGYNTTVAAGARYTGPHADPVDAGFCNVTVQYIHPGENDHVITVEAWLPPDESWNQRFQAVGGGGWNAGRSYFGRQAMSEAIADGFATIVTDAGLGETADIADWALIRPGEVDMIALKNLGYQSLEDEVGTPPNPPTPLHIPPLLVHIKCSFSADLCRHCLARH